MLQSSRAVPVENQIGPRRYFDSASFEKEITMPLTSNEKLIALSQDLLKQCDTIFRVHPGFPPKGVMLTGAYTLSRCSFTNTGA
jgi:hypothetical protein